MMERVLERAKRLAERRARERVLDLAESMRAQVPADVAVEAGSDGVRIGGRGIGRRFALDAGLRWLTARLR